MSVIDSLVYPQTNKENCRGQKSFSFLPKKKIFFKGSALWRALAKIWWLTNMHVGVYINIYIYIWNGFKLHLFIATDFHNIYGWKKTSLNISLI